MVLEAEKYFHQGNVSVQEEMEVSSKDFGINVSYITQHPPDLILVANTGFHYKTYFYKRSVFGEEIVILLLLSNWRRRIIILYFFELTPYKGGRCGKIAARRTIIMRSYTLPQTRKKSEAESIRIELLVKCP